MRTHAHAPNLKAVGPLHLAQAPGNFTYTSHAAMFMGFTPGVAARPGAYIRDKIGTNVGAYGAGTAALSSLLGACHRCGYIRLEEGRVEA